jgi:hypothetical protein
MYWWTFLILKVSFDQRGVNMSSEYPTFIIMEGSKVSLNILTDCPLYDKQGGLCSACSFYRGLNLRVVREGKCGVAIHFKPIEEFRSRRSCPDLQERNNGADCHHCEHFLGFADNRGFYCEAKEK